MNRLPEKFRNKFVVLDNGCWQWQGAKNSHGYGEITINKAGLASHRVSYEYLVGEISDGMTIDHLCRNRACVNPEHMEAVSIRENILRGVSPSAINARKTHCLKGHKLEGDNLYLRKTKFERRCRECYRQRTTLWRKKGRSECATQK